MTKFIILPGQGVAADCLTHLQRRLGEAARNPALANIQGLLGSAIAPPNLRDINAFRRFVRQLGDYCAASQLFLGVRSLGNGVVLDSGRTFEGRTERDLHLGLARSPLFVRDLDRFWEDQIIATG